MIFSASFSESTLVLKTSTKLITGLLDKYLKVNCLMDLSYKILLRTLFFFLTLNMGTILLKYINTTLLYQKSNVDIGKTYKLVFLNHRQIPLSILYNHPNQNCKQDYRENNIIAQCKVLSKYADHDGCNKYCSKWAKTRNNK